MPTMETVTTMGGKQDMKVTAGVLTLSADGMPMDVVIGEGLCMGSDDGEDGDEAEREDGHDLFGDIVAEMCQE